MAAAIMSTKDRLNGSFVSKKHADRPTFDMFRRIAPNHAKGFRGGSFTVPRFFRWTSLSSGGGGGGGGGGGPSLSGGTIKGTMSESGGSLGGYLAPIDYSLALFKAIDEHTFIEQRALMIPMNSAETQCPKPDLETQGALGVSPFHGGITFGCGLDGYTLPETEPVTKQLSLYSWTMAGQIVVSNQFIEDIGEEGELALMRLFGRAIGWYKEWLFLRGTGASTTMPLGILVAPATISSSRSGGGPVLADIANMASRLIPSSWNSAIWACNPEVLLKIGQITGFIPNTSPHDEIGQDCAGYLFGRPLFVTEKLPPLATAGDLIFFDPQLYVVGNREEVTISASPHPLFRNNQTVLRVELRGDGKPLLDKAVKLADGSSTTKSGYVLLAA